MAITLLTPAQNRFLQLTQPALELPALTQVLPVLRDHPTVKDTSDFLTRSTRALIQEQRLDWLVTGSLAWKLLARLPYAINASDRRADWHHCALCHKPVRYEYHVVLRATGREILVGSECVKKFMSDEMQYLMAITTEDNFHAVAQYDALTDHYPVVPEILWTKDALPDLPERHRRRQRWVHNGTKSTVTGYLRRRTQKLPDEQLAPYLTAYDQLRLSAQAATAKRHERVQRQQQRAQDLAAKEEQAAWAAANTAQSAAEKALRASADYRGYLGAVAGLLTQHLSLAAFKAQLATIPMPQALNKLVNSYQLGVMATEFARTGQIKAARLQIVPRYLVADLNRQTRRLAAQRQRDWDDDVFNAAVGFELTPAQRQTQLAQLRQSWEGRQVPSTVYAQLLHLKADLAAGQPVPVDWPERLRTALQQRLDQQPTTGWVPARKNHVTTEQLRQLVQGRDSFTVVAADYHRLYQLAQQDEALTLSALQQYYLVQQDRQAGRAPATQKLVQQLLQTKD
ncbi:hypothetical protein [Levilactobacillus tujiorum]|uniref:hypothetical protein n=1 Tax=Levilactobacillus tujiorum TaxID=2912243 RepID=UPI001456B023|nr:hypothetical protein [Levilactobacillus tujiorum]NLR31982.1 hypothetical protein [Levilactobacillus tujiorum]